MCVHEHKGPVHLNVCAHEHKWTVESLCVVHAHVFACKSQRVTLDFFLSHSTPYFWQGLSLSTELTDLTKQMAIKPQGCSCLILIVLWLQVHSAIPSFLHWCWEFELRSLWLQNKHLTNCCNSPAIFLFSLYTVLGWLRVTSLPSVPASLFQYFYSIPWSFVLDQEFGSISFFCNYSIIDIIKSPSLFLWG